MKKVSRILLTVFIFLFVQYPLLTFAQTLLANDFTKSTPRDTTLSFSATDFVNSTSLPQGKQLVSVRFDQVTNPTAGNLKLNANIVSRGSTISVNDLNSLTFVPTAGYEGEAIFTWTAIVNGGQSPYPGAVVITIGAGDKTPSEIDDAVEESQSDESVKPEENKTPTPQTTPAQGEQQKEDKGNKESAQKQESAPKKENAPTKESTEASAEKSENQTQPTKTSTDSERGLKPLRYEDMLDHWGAYSAGMLASRGYVIGEDYGNRFYFHPDTKISRLEFVLMVNAIFGVQPKDSLQDNPFSDKGVPAYVMRVGIAAHEYDIIEGTKGKDGRLYFNPYDPITRAEAVTIIDYALRLDSYGVDEAEFKDTVKIPDWALQSVKNLEAYGILQGYEDNTLRPNENITRAQAAELVWQSLKFLDLKRGTNAVFKTVIYGD